MKDKQNSKINTINYKCKECKQEFKEKEELERHSWKIHPKNKYEKTWSNIDFTSYSGSSFYRDDPYY